MTLKLSCNMNLKKFPMDVQICHMRTQSFSYTTADLILAWDPNKHTNNGIQLSPELELLQFEIRGYKLADCTNRTNEKTHFSCIQLSLK